LIETTNGRILFDVGCDYQKIQQDDQRKQYYENDAFPFGPPEMSEEERLPNRLEVLGLQSEDIDLVFCSHLHFDHAGGLCEFCHAEVHVHAKEMQAAKEPADDAYFASDFELPLNWKIFPSRCLEFANRISSFLPHLFSTSFPMKLILFASITA